MKPRFTFLALLIVIVMVLGIYSYSGNGDKARRPAILDGAARVAALQRTDAGWAGTWYWYVGSTGNATNLTGVTALGLLEAFRDVKDSAYLDAAVGAAGFIQAHLGAGATGTQYHVRTTAPDVVFLHQMGEVTGDPAYTARAELEWENLTSFWPTAGDLDTLFRGISRPSTWDIAFFLEAAYLSGDTDWADDAAAILADVNDSFYYDISTFWYPLNVAASIRALVGCGYYTQYSDAVISLLGELIGLSDEENGVGGGVQDTAYAVMAFNTVGGAARKFGNSLGRWLAQQQQDNGGWLEGGYEYPEIDGEALRALAATIGSNITLDGFEKGLVMNSSWRRVYNNAGGAKPFNGN
jgi:hypothetical protein